MMETSTAIKAAGDSGGSLSILTLIPTLLVYSHQKSRIEVNETENKCDNISSVPTLAATNYGR